MELPASALVEMLRYLPLLTPEQQREAARLIETLPTAKDVAEQLVRLGWITPFQGEVLSAGRGYDLMFGSYLLLDKLGEGGMGEVFRARHRHMGRDAALKRMLPHLSRRPDLVERFLREGRAVAKLSHPNVVQIHDVNEVKGAYYLAMEYLRGENLAMHLARRGPLPVGEALEYVRQACVGMQHVHEQKLVHRDLKPGNLMLTDAGQVKILDLGMALLATDETLTQTGHFLGTWEYVAPEQMAQSHGVDVRADVYSLGCVLYHLLTGRIPISFDGVVWSERLKRANSLEPLPVERLRADVPKDVSDVVRKMMAKHPDDRHQTPGEAAMALAAFLSCRENFSSPSTAAPIPMPVRSETKIELPPLTPPTVQPEPSDPPTAPRSDEQAAGPPRSFTNAVGMMLVLVDAGSFVMGSPDYEEDRSDDEERHEVTITRPFYLGVHPVTQRQYAAVMGKNPSHFTPTGAGKAKVKGWFRTLDTSDFPVEGVSWDDAQQFLKRLNARAQGGWPRVAYRLPTEAEWEYACRGGPNSSGKPFHFGDPADSLSSDAANFNGELPYGAAKGRFVERTTRVGSYRPNRLGLYDMHGNVWEWCACWHGPYPRGRVTDPKGPATGTGRVGRGGGWSNGGQRCRAASREWFTPSFRHFYLGFRVAAELVEEAKAGHSGRL